MTLIRLQLLGEFEMQVRGSTVVPLTAHKNRALLAFLALPAGKVHQRASLAALLWSKQSPDAARTNLRQSLTAIRKAMGRESAKCLKSSGQQLQLDETASSSDVSEFEAACQAASRESLVQAIQLYQYPLLDGFTLDEPEFDEWMSIQRSRLHEAYMSALHRLLALYEADEDFERVVDIGNRLLTQDSLQEPVYRSVMKAYAGLGRLGAAQRQYELCTATLMDELGLKPDNDTRVLHRTIMSQPSAPSDAGLLPANIASITARSTERVKPAITPGAWKSVAVGALMIAGVGVWSLEPGSDSSTGQVDDKSSSLIEPDIWADSVRHLNAANLAVLEGKPSMAVLPFTNNGNNPDELYFSDGLSDDLITELSRVSGLRVVARRSSFSFRESTKKSQQIATTLGVRYLLDGSVRRDDQRVRINASLIDTQTGLNLWAERFDGELSDIMALQDAVTVRIVEALSVTLTDTEQQRLASPISVNPDAYDALLRGLFPFREFTAQGNEEARRFFSRAVEIDPLFARAHANLALTFGRDVFFRYTELQREQIEIGLDVAATAESLDPRLPQTQFAVSVLSMASRQHAAAVTAARRSIYLDPNYADGYAVLAQALSYSGFLDEAIRAVQSAKLLNPLYPFGYLFVEGHTRYLQGEHEKALPLLREAVDRNPSFIVGHLLLAATYAQLGLLDDAQWQLSEVEALDPRISLSTEVDESLYLNPQQLDHLLGGLRKAGLPD